MRLFGWSSVLSFLTICVAEPIANPEAVPQALTNNAPFSGAVYIVNPNGNQIGTQGNNVCPSSASVSCSSVNEPSWCCPANYICAVPGNSNGLIGCCPSGSSCSGAVNAAQVTTMTVNIQQQTATVYSNPNVAQGGFCQTLTETGPGLPTTRQGPCGTILIVSESTPSLKILGIGMSAVALLLHLALGRMFNR